MGVGAAAPAPPPCSAKAGAEAADLNSPKRQAAKNCARHHRCASFLKAGADRDQADGDGRTPLFIAAREGHHVVVRLLLEAGADKDKASNKDGSTPLFMAAQANRREVVRLLLAADADKEKAKEDGTTPLLVAACKGHGEVVADLLKAGADKDRADDKRGETPLYMAAIKGNLKVVELLLGAGADKDKAEKDGKTPLWCAAHCGYDGIVDMLLEAGANKDKAEDNNGWTPLLVAAQNRRNATSTLLLKAGASVDHRIETELGYTSLHIAGLRGDGEAEVARLLEAGAAVNGLNIHGDDALFLAAEAGHFEVAVKLIAAGAHVNRAATHFDEGGRSPLHVAAKGGHHRVVAQLLVADANKDVVDEGTQTWTPALCAACWGRRETLRLLLEAGARPVTEKTSVLHIAAQLGYLETVKDIVCIYPNPDAWYTLLAGGYTARKAAITLPPAQRSFLEKLYEDDEKVVLKLVRSFLYKPRYQRDLNAKNEEGSTAMELVAGRIEDWNNADEQDDPRLLAYKKIAQVLEGNGAAAPRAQVA